MLLHYHGQYPMTGKQYRTTHLDDAVPLRVPQPVQLLHSHLLQKKQAGRKQRSAESLACTASLVRQLLTLRCRRNAPVWGPALLARRQLHPLPQGPYPPASPPGRHCA